MNEADLKYQIAELEKQIQNINTRRTGAITVIRKAKKSINKLKHQLKLIELMKNQKELARQVINRDDWRPMDIKISDKHLERLHGVAEAFGLNLNETATFLLYAYMNDVELQAKIEAQKITN